MNIFAVAYCLNTNNSCGETTEMQNFDYLKAGSLSCREFPKILDFDWCGQ